MTGYIILAVFAVLIFSHFALFLAGVKKGYKKAEAEYAEERAMKEKDAQQYEKAKNEIIQEVFHEAAEQKAELSAHSNNRDRFNAINDRLSNKPKN